jgi:hypothetical protein
MVEANNSRMEWGAADCLENSAALEFRKMC